VVVFGFAELFRGLTELHLKEPISFSVFISVNQQSLHLFQEAVVFTDFLFVFLHVGSVLLIVIIIMGSQERELLEKHLILLRKKMRPLLELQDLFA